MSKVNNFDLNVQVTLGSELGSPINPKELLEQLNEERAQWISRSMETPQASIDLSLEFYHVLQDFTQQMEQRRLETIASDNPIEDPSDLDLRTPQGQALLIDYFEGYTHKAFKLFQGLNLVEHLASKGCQTTENIEFTIRYDKIHIISTLHLSKDLLH